MTNLLHGDVLDMLRTLDSESVHCCVTSPPYWNLRNYNVDGQIGLEDTLDEYVEKMVSVFREVRRVLRNDGTLWLNLGDSYNGVGRKEYQTSRSPKQISSKGAETHPGTNVSYLKPKDLIGVPWLIAFALRSDGWYLRSDIIWAKPNPMPESVTDRPTKSHEYMFLLTKSSKYYYDGDSIREPHKEPERSGTPEKMWSPNVSTDEQFVNGGFGRGKYTQRIYNPFGRNIRTVWTIPTQPTPEAHFATFPEALIVPCIKAGCPEGGTVLDPFFGSGTTGIVAKKLNRKWIGIELNPEYIKIAERRIEKECGLLF